MEITLRPAHEVPEVFAERMQSRVLGERVLATTMSIDFVDNPILDALAQHGLPEDILGVDYCGHANGPSALFLGHKGHAAAREEFERDFPGSYVVLGKPVHGRYYEGKALHRSHIKALAVGPKILSLGGVNFVDFAYENYVDAMLDFRSPEFADFLDSFIEQNGNLRGREEAGESFDLSDRHTVLVDYGKNGQSLIMSNVLADLSGEEVQSVTMTSSYGPAGHLYKRLHRLAEGGSEVTVYTNYPSKFQKPHSAMLEEEMQGEDLGRIAWGNLGRHHKIQVIDRLPAGKFTHLKTLILEGKAGKIAYMGSHNFHPLPVECGTAEVALRTTDVDLIGQIEDFIASHLTV